MGADEEAAEAIDDKKNLRQVERQRKFERKIEKKNQTLDWNLGKYLET